MDVINEFNNYLFLKLKLPSPLCLFGLNKFRILEFFKQNIFISETDIVSLQMSKLWTIRIITYKKLKEFYQTPGHEDSAVALQDWYHNVKSANWRNFADIKAMYPSVDYVGNQHYFFNIRGNNYRLVVVIKFVLGWVYIRFVGTHTEYDKIDCSTI